MNGPTACKPREVQCFELGDTLYQNGLRGCHFARVCVNLWKLWEVPYLQTLSFSTGSMGVAIFTSTKGVATERGLMFETIQFDRGIRIAEPSAKR